MPENEKINEVLVSTTKNTISEGVIVIVETWQYELRKVIHIDELNNQILDLKKKTDELIELKQELEEVIG